MTKQPEILEIPFPETEDMERQVLADVVASPEMMGDVLPLIHPDFFTKSNRRHIWEVIVEHYNKGRSFDLATMVGAIGKDFLEEVAPMVGYSGGTIGVMEHAVLLRTGAARRRAYYAASIFLTGAVNPRSTEADILSSVEAFAHNVEGPAPLQEETKLSEALKEVRHELEVTAKAAAAGERLRIATGFHYMDGALNGGFAPGQLIVLAARPSVGKTSFMLQLAKNAAAANYPAFIFSMEQTIQELTQKFLQSTGKVKAYNFTTGQVDWQLYEQAENEVRPLAVFIDDFTRSLDDLVTRLTQAVKQGRCRIAFVDYLGLLADTYALSGNVKLYQVIAKITGTLKAVAKRLRIPIVLLCQLNREQAKEKRAPELFDLRDSGSIEQDADVVLMLEPKPDEGRIVAWLRKNRGGRRVDASGNGLGFVLVPNENYSAFEEGLPTNQLTAPTATSTAQNGYQPEPKEQEETQGDLPF